MAYSYFFITDKDDAIDDVISCNEAKVHQALVRDMCPRAQEAQAKSKKIGNRKTKGSRIVVNIESLPEDIAAGSCPDDTLDQLGDDETCQKVTGGITLTLALAKALELEEIQLRRLGSNDESERDELETRMGSSSVSGIKDGMRRLQEDLTLTEEEAKKVREELEKTLKNLMKEMNRSLALGLSKKELKEQQKKAKEAVTQLTIEDLQKLISGEYKVDADVDYTEGDGFTFSFVPATESPSDRPSLSPSHRPSLSPSDHPSLSPSESLSPSDHPSLSPSNHPSSSLSPSDHPSLSPSDHPSLSPSDHPSLSPSNHPSSSLSPSDHPSLSPSEFDCARTNSALFAGTWHAFLVGERYTTCVEYNFFTTNFIENEAVAEVQILDQRSGFPPQQDQFTLVLGNCVSITEITLCGFYDDYASCGNFEYNSDGTIRTSGEPISQGPFPGSAQGPAGSCF